MVDKNTDWIIYTFSNVDYRDVIDIMDLDSEDLEIETKEDLDIFLQNDIIENSDSFFDICNMYDTLQNIQSLVVNCMEYKGCGKYSKREATYAVFSYILNLVLKNVDRAIMNYR